VSQAFLSKSNSQSSSLIPEQQQDIGKESAIHQTASHSASSASLLAVHVFSASNQDAHVVSQNDRLQPFLNNLSSSNRSKMSSGDAGPGDTQPISQTVFDSIMSRSKLLSTSQEGSHVDIDMHDADEGTLHMTFQEGDPGHTDLLAGFGDSNPSEPHDLSDNDLSSSKPDDSSPVYTFRNSQQFMTTPLIVEKLQNGRGLASATPLLPRNPLATDLSSSGGMMALSQVFRATQAPSSPFVNGLPSGPLSDRPSPNIPIQARPMHKFTSSPLRTPRSNLHRTHTDPHSYVSMDESQKQRNKIIEDRRTRSVENMGSEDQSDDEFDKESSFVRRLRLQKKIDEETHARLAAVSRDTPRKVVPDSSMSWAKTASQELASLVEGDTQPLASNEGISEEETEQEDNAVAPSSQNRQHISSSEEDKENFMDPVDDMDTTTSAHDRLSQALHLTRSPSAVQSLPAEKETLATEHSLAASEQIINVRDSQPSPSQGGPEIQQNARPPSEQEFDEVHSSPDDLQPPAKRPRFQQETDQESVKQLSQRRSNSPLLIHSTARSSQHNSNSSAPVPSANTVNTTEKPSSMPSLVANTPINKVDNHTIPETSIPESSPKGSRQEVRPAEAKNKFSPIPEAEQEDDDLPTPHHRRNWDNFMTGPSPSGTPSALRNAAPRQKKLFVSSSPMGGKIKSLSEISAEHSPQPSPDGEIAFEILNAGDKEFSDIVDAFDHQTPTKKRRKTAGTTPLRSELSHSTTPKPDVNRAVNQPVHYEQPSVPESPEPSHKPTVVRRKRGRPRRTENLWDIEETPPSTAPKLPKQYSSEKKPSKTKLPFTVSVTIPIKSQSSQNSFVSEKSAPGRIERQSRETSAATTSRPPTEYEAATPKAHTPLPEERIIAPNQVFAAWNGMKRAYYPARFVGAGGHKGCIVKFTDSSPTDVALGSIKKLQLQIGDSVKVDLPGVPKIIHVVQGFSGQLSVDELTTADNHGSLPVTDIYGRSTLILTAKNRKSPRRGGHMEPDQTVEVPMHSIYLDMNLWNQLKGRTFTLAKTESIPNKIQTPTIGIPTSVSPGSKLSHVLMQAGLFAGMVFAVSFGNQDVAKDKITKLISENGGHILRDGFEELFDFPSSVPHVRDQSADEVQFGLASGCEEIGFACLVADKHSRRAKYMQALALNVPCLSGRWVEDCVRENQILDWACYLLPAGESKFLDGATKSRILTPTPAEQAKFSETLVGRPKILEGQSVLLVMGGGKAADRRKAYLFLTYALGAARVERVFDLKSAKATLDAQTKDYGGWDWLYVDDGEEAAATKMIMGRAQGGSGPSKKRKRSLLFNESTNDKPEKDAKNVRIVSNDFVCQSLILGKIYEP
jgi:DNA repair protein RAD9